MGGLVVKKAFVLAETVPDFKGRIRSIFFLATPHRGSDYAALLNNILTVSGFLSPRQYLNDLTSGSTSAQLINDEFAKLASELPVFSFYETLRMSMGISSSLIVDKTSAVLGQVSPFFSTPLEWLQLTLVISRSRLCKRASSISECQPP